jgi:cellulose biosynthesis protein BcsQ
MKTIVIHNYSGGLFAAQMSYHLARHLAEFGFQVTLFHHPYFQ